MPSIIIKAAILALLATPALSIPQAAAPSATVGPLKGEEDIINLQNYPFARGGAIDMANRDGHKGPLSKLAAPHKPAVTAAPTALTFVIKNRAGVPVHTRHARNFDSPRAIGGDVGPGILADGADEGLLRRPPALGRQRRLRGRGRTQAGVSDEPIVDVDVSYVSGFSIPITCDCDGRGAVTGCNKDLWALNSCGDDNGAGSCRNPMRAVLGEVEPDAFFAPCRGAAFTYPDDHGANSNNDCRGDTTTCCVGSACPPGIKQSGGL